MNLKRCTTYLFLLGTLHLSIPLFSQRTTEQEKLDSLNKSFEKGWNQMGFMVGGSGYLGDIGGNLGRAEYYLKDYVYRDSKGLLGFYGSYGVARAVDVRTTLMVTQLQADDASIKSNGGEERWRLYRNLNFKSLVAELSMSFDINPMYIFKRYALSEKRKSTHPYFSMGIGVFMFEPKMLVDGEWHKVRPLSLEGQGFEEYKDRKPYSNIQFCIPVGLGVRHNFKNSMSASLEFVYRKTFTDYLDDVSKTYIEPDRFDNHLSVEQATLAKKIYKRHKKPTGTTPGLDRGHSNDFDAYFSVQLRLGFLIE